MGVPLPVFYAENGEIIMTKETVNHVADLFAEHGSNIWFERGRSKNYTRRIYTSSSPNGTFTKETDVMDIFV
ncbi:class I tRNA ligase family protein [Staphylococcus aureus]